MKQFESLVPKSAIVLYGNPNTNTCNYAQTHPVEIDSNGSFSLQAGLPLCQDALREAVLSLAEESQTIQSDLEFIPNNMLAYQPVKQTMIWYQPAQKRAIYFDANRDNQSIKDSFLANWPALLFIVSNNEFNVYALTSDKRPNLTSKIYHAPLWNINNAGSVCIGSANNPKHFGINAMEAWENVIYDSAFAHPNGSIQRTKTDDFIGVWKTARETKFPKKEMVNANISLQDILNKFS